MKKLTLFFAAIFTIAFNNIYAQITFEKTYGGESNDFGSSVLQTSDGGYIITGTTNSFGAVNSDVYLIKTSSNGDTLWTKTFGGINYDGGFSVHQTSDEGYIIAGSTESFGAGSIDVYLIKTDASGDTLWTKTFGGTEGDGGYSVQQTNDGGYIVAGTTSSFGAVNDDIYLIKTNNIGDTLWTKTFGGVGREYGSSVQQTSDGGYVIAGNTNSFGAGLDDVYLIKTNSNGDTLWTKTFGGTRRDYGASAQQTSDGGFIIVGTIESFASSIDVYLIKTNSIGETLWTKTFGGRYQDFGNSIQQTSDGGFIIAGNTTSFGQGDENVFLIKTNISGDSLWAKTFGGISIDGANSVQLTSDGGYIVAGLTNSFGAGDYDVYLIKTDGNGDVISSIEDKTKNTLKVNVFPNPTSNKLYINIAQQDNQPIQYQINNTLGATIITNKATTKEFNIDVSTLATGIYFIHLQSGNAQTVKRFVKE